MQFARVVNLSITLQRGRNKKTTTKSVVEFANKVDPDDVAQCEASYQDLHSLQASNFQHETFLFFLNLQTEFYLLFWHLRVQLI